MKRYMVDGSRMPYECETGPFVKFHDIDRRRELLETARVLMAGAAYSRLSVGADGKACVSFSYPSEDSMVDRAAALIAAVDRKMGGE